MKTIGYNKEEIKDKFDKFYTEGNKWSFSLTDPMYVVKKDILKPILDKSKNILDLGCADGEFLASLKDINSNKKIIGVDISDIAINKAKQRNTYRELYTGYIDYVDLYTQNVEKFDLILLNEVLYYVDNYIQVLNTILKLSAKYVFVSLAMGPQFFAGKEAQNIENNFKQNGYKLVRKDIFDMSYKGGMPIRYWTFIYSLLGKRLKQTHKYIYIFEKI